MNTNRSFIKTTDISNICSRQIALMTGQKEELKANLGKLPDNILENWDTNGI